MNKDIKKLAKEIEKEVETFGWTIESHTKVLALLNKIINP